MTRRCQGSETREQESGLARIAIDIQQKSTTIWLWIARGPASVHGLTEPFALSQQMISKHIAYLVRARIVSKTKRGRESICKLRPESIKAVSEWAVSYRQFWEESFDKLDVVVNRMKKAEARDDKKHGE
jgi:predicted transcriptional regulator